MRAVLPVSRLFRWHQQQFFHQRSVKIEQKGPVKKNPVALPALRIPGKF